MDYKNYINSRNLAWEIILQEEIKELPVKISALCRQMGIKLKYYIPMDNNGGKAELINGTAVIFVNENDEPERQRFTIAHELGHILLGHVGKYQLVNREPSADDNPIEQAANVFAVRLLAPACVLWGCGVQQAEDIMQLCKISYTASCYRMERMKLLYKRNKFLIHPLERYVYNQFKDYIDSHKL